MLTYILVAILLCVLVSASGILYMRCRPTLLINTAKMLGVDGVGGGYVAYDRNKVTKKEKLYEGTEGLHLFFDCNYSSEKMVQVTGERLPKTEENETSISMTNGFKSFVLTGGYKLDAYQNTNLEGSMITHTCA